MVKNGNRPYYYIERTVNVLIIDDQKEVADALLKIVERFPLYSCHVSTGYEEALATFESLGRIHVCISDLGIQNSLGDEFALLRQFSRMVPFIIFTGSVSPRSGFLAHRYGAYDIIEKTPTLKQTDFLKTIDRAALRSIINPHYNDDAGGDALSAATDVLFANSPQFVSQWAQLCGVTDRALRYLWTKNLGANVKIILAVYHIFMNALTYYEQQNATERPDADSLPINHAHYRRLEEFFHLHKSTITDFIRYGNIVVSR